MASWRQKLGLKTYTIKRAFKVTLFFQMKTHDRGHKNKKVLAKTYCNIRFDILPLVCREFCRTTRWLLYRSR